MVSIVTIILAMGSFWIPLIFGLVFLLFPVPNVEMLKSYYKTKYFMGFAYLALASVSLFFLLTNHDFHYNDTIQVAIPAVAIIHTIIFTFTNIILIKPNYYNLRKNIQPLIPASIFIVVYFAAYIYNPNGTLWLVMYYVLLSYFAVLLVCYSRIFSRHYLHFKEQLDNYFSELSYNHLRWVLHSQATMVSMGIVVLFAGFLPVEYMIVFLGGMNIFFFYYAIRYIQYSNTFSLFEDFFNELKDEKETKTTGSTLTQLETALTEWEQEKKFTTPNLTVENVAASLYTNRTYLSNYINSNKNMTFYAWINELRINEAKSLLTEEPNVPIYEISEQLGFSDKSNFSRQFTKITGSSPSAWRKDALEIKKLE